MNDLVRVSVCIMTYNQRPYLRQCLESIVNQICNFRFEVIVADDYSNDGAREIIEEFAQNYPGVVHPILRDHNVGVTQNYIELHTSASGEYVAHCDGDDFWLPGKLQYQVDLLDANPSFSQTWCCASVVDDSGRMRAVFPSRLARQFYPTIIGPAEIALSYGLVGQHSTQLYRRKFQPKYNPDEPILDYWIAFQLSLNGNAYYSKKILSAYRVASLGSLTNTRSRKKYSVDALALALVRIVRRYPTLGLQAKANAMVRYWFSRVKGHDLTTATKALEELRDVPVRIGLVLRCAFYFILQKLP